MVKSQQTKAHTSQVDFDLKNDGQERQLPTSVLRQAG